MRFADFPAIVERKILIELLCPCSRYFCYITTRLWRWLMLAWITSDECIVYRCYNMIDAGRLCSKRTILNNICFKLLFRHFRVNDLPWLIIMNEVELIEGHSTAEVLSQSTAEVFLVPSCDLRATFLQHGCAVLWTFLGISHLNRFCMHPINNYFNFFPLFRRKLNVLVIYNWSHA